jgi:hypothetical protein
MSVIRVMPDRKVGIIILILAVAIFVVFFAWFYGTVQSHDREGAGNLTEKKLPDAISKELDRAQQEKGFFVSKWEMDTEQKKVVLFVVDMSEEQINTLQGKKVDGWVITVTPDMEYITEMEAARSELLKLEQDPEMQISGFSMELSRKEVTMWVYNRTPENRALDGKEIHGWTVHVWVALTPTETGANRC